MDFLLHGDSYVDQDLFYATGFLGEPLTYVSDGTLLVPEMERSRAEEESGAERVVTLDDLGYGEKREGSGKWEAYADCVEELLDDAGIDGVAVPPGLPALLYGHLSRSRSLEIDEDLLVEERRTKSRDEVAGVEAAVSAAEAAIGMARKLVAEAEARDGELRVDGEPLTAERLRREMEHVLVDRGCSAVDMIAAPGEESRKPHWRGSGPIREGEPVVVDVFPRHRESRYCGDMTRTILRGDGPRVEEMHRAVVEALEAAEEAAAPGEACSEVHAAAAGKLEEEGFETDDGEGFVHSVGHGVGLDVHEPPRLSEESDDVLREGDIFTLEPGLYYEGVGGVRVEDTFVARGDGCRSLSGSDRGLTP